MCVVSRLHRILSLSLSFIPCVCGNYDSLDALEHEKVRDPPLVVKFGDELQYEKSRKSTYEIEAEPSRRRFSLVNRTHSHSLCVRGKKKKKKAKKFCSLIRNCKCANLFFSHTQTHRKTGHVMMIEQSERDSVKLKVKKKKRARSMKCTCSTHAGETQESGK